MLLVKALDYFLLLPFLGLLACILYSWTWWHRKGRHNRAQCSMWGKLALIYSTVLPALLMGLRPMCNVPLSYANSGIRFAAIGVLAALLIRGRGRTLLAANVTG